MNKYRVIKGWYPLVVEKSITWLVYLQVKLRFPLDVIDRPSTSSQPGGGTNIFKQYLDKATGPQVDEPVDDSKCIASRAETPMNSSLPSSPTRKKQTAYLHQLDDFF